MNESYDYKEDERYYNRATDRSAGRDRTIRV